MPWGIAASDVRAQILWYRSTAPNQDGLPSQVHDIQGCVWDAFEEKKDVQAAWAMAVGTQRDQSVICTATRNHLRCKLNFFPIPKETAVVSFSRWAPNSALNEQEMDVCLKSVAGASNKDIAVSLAVSVQRVNEIKRSAMEKLKCSTPEQLGSYFSVTEGLQF